MIEIIKRMQEGVLERSPKYGMRKLSVGLVSCFLGYGIISSPTVVNAQVIEGTSIDPELQYIQEDIQRHKTNTVVSNSTDNEVMNKNNVNNTKVIENTQSIKPKSTPELGNRNIVTNSNYSVNSPADLGNRSLEISNNSISSPVAAAQNNNRVEKLVTDETKTPNESKKVGDIDKTIINENNEFVGKENGQVSISGNKDIASKEDLDKEMTVDEFNKKARIEKKAELEVKIEENLEEIENINNDIDKRVQDRSEDLINNFKEAFKTDLEELDKYGDYGVKLSTNPKYYEKSKGFSWDYYDYWEETYTPGGGRTIKYPNREQFNKIKLHAEEITYNKDTTGSVSFLLVYRKPDRGGSRELNEYIENSNLENRLNDFLNNYKDKYYALDKKYYDDLEKEITGIANKNKEMWDQIRSLVSKDYAYIKEEDLRPKTVEIIKDPTIWEGNSTWERYSKDGYIKTLIQNGEEIATRVQHPLVGIKRVGTKTEETRERREVESSTYDVIEKPTINPDENGKVIQEGSNGLVEKVYDATYDKFSNVIKKELKETIVNKEQKDRIVLRYGIKEETKTPATLYDGIKNYSDDEKKIKDFSEDKRYRETDLQPGDTIQNLTIIDEKDNDGKRIEKDGFKFITKNPSAGDLNKTEYGYQITIDKKTGQRTYTKIDVTDSGLIFVEHGNKSMMGREDKITAEFPAVTYKPNENTDITASARQRNLNYVASEETLKHINSKDNESTSFGFKDNYTQDNPKNKFFEGSFGITYKVNPWPDENDKLNKIKLNGTYDEKVYVKGQDIKTKIKVDNLDKNAHERLVGQVYNPVTGNVLKEAEAYIDDEGYVHIKMPKGVINDDGTINKDSIFSTPEY